MNHLTPAQLEAFYASPEMEAAFNRWSAKYTAAATADLSPAMVDMSEGALQPFPAYDPEARVGVVACGKARALTGVANVRFSELTVAPNTPTPNPPPRRTSCATNPPTQMITTND